jgi:hypothetical protein
MKMEKRTVAQVEDDLKTRQDFPLYPVRVGQVIHGKGKRTDLPFRHRVAEL